MTTITIDPDTCKNDGACAMVCPTRTLRQREDQPPRVDAPEHCVLCGQCMAVCPHGAITHSRLESERFARIVDRRPVGADAMLAALKQRRSVRVYRNKAVPRDLLEQVVSVAGFAPTSAHGGAGWVRSVTVVADEETMRRVVELTAAYMTELGALLDSMMVRFMSRFSEKIQGGRAMLDDLRMRLAEREAGRDAITYDAPAAIFVHTPRTTPEPNADCDAALMAIMLNAQAHGLGTCWNGWLAKAGSAFKLEKHTQFRELLQLPDDHDVLAAATIGYPGIKLHSTPHRETAIHFVS